MGSETLLFLTGAAVIASGLVAGVFLTFSDFVMKSLAAAGPTGGIVPMQMINRKVYRSLFMALFLGLTVASLGLVVYAVTSLSGPERAWTVAGGVAYLVGVFLVTMICSVPMNNRLDVMEAAVTETATFWPDYVRSWTRWNHVRTAACAASSVFYLIATVWFAGT